MRSETATLVVSLFLVMLVAFVIGGNAALPWMMIVGGLVSLMWIGYRMATISYLASHSDKPHSRDDRHVNGYPRTNAQRTVLPDAPTQPGSAWEKYDDEVLDSMQQTMPPPVAETMTDGAPPPVADAMTDGATLPVADAMTDGAPLPVADAMTDGAPLPVADAMTDGATLPVADAMTDGATLPVADAMTDESLSEDDDEEEMMLMFLRRPSSSSANASLVDSPAQPGRGSIETAWEQNVDAVSHDTSESSVSFHEEHVSPSLPPTIHDVIDEDHGHAPVRASALARRYDHQVRAALDVLSDTLGDSLHNVVVAAEIPCALKRAGHVVEMTVWVDYASVHHVHATLQDAAASERIGWFQWRAQPSGNACHVLDIWRSTPHSLPHAHERYGWVPLGFVIHGGKKRTFAYPLLSRKRLAIVVDDHHDLAIRDSLLDVHFMLQRVGGRLQWLDERTYDMWRNVLPDVTVYDARTHAQGSDPQTMVVAAYALDARQFRAVHLEALDSTSSFVCFVGRDVQSLVLEQSWPLMCDDGGERRLLWERDVWTMKRMASSFSPV